MRSYFGSENFPDPEFVGMAIKKETVSEFIKLLDKVASSFSVADIIELADWKGFLEQHISQGEILDDVKVHMGRDLSTMSLPKYIEDLRAEERKRAAKDINNLGLAFQSLLQKPAIEDTVLEQNRCPRRYARIARIFDVLFKEQKDRAVSYFARVISGFSLYDLHVMGKAKGLLKIEYDAVTGRDVNRGLRADRITVMEALERIRLHEFPDASDMESLHWYGKEELYKLNKPLFGYLRDKLIDNFFFGELFLAGYCIEKVPIKEILAAIKEMLCEISLFEFIKYTNKDFIDTSPLHGQTYKTVDYKIGAMFQKQGIRNVYRALPSYHPVSLRLKFALSDLGVSVDELKPARKEETTEDNEIVAMIGATGRMDPGYFTGLLDHLTLQTVLNMLLDLGYVDLVLDASFTDAVSSRLRERGRKINGLKLGSMIKLLSKGNHTNSDKTFLQAFPEQLSFDAETGRFGGEEKKWQL